jgi:hypothetical protein
VPKNITLLSFHLAYNQLFVNSETLDTNYLKKTIKRLPDFDFFLRYSNLKIGANRDPNLAVNRWRNRFVELNSFLEIMDVIKKLVF